MTGLDLETFLLLLRADLSAWLMLGLACVGLAGLVWVCWGSRRALRKCLVLSLAAHLGIVLFGSTVPAIQLAIRRESTESADRAHIRRIRVAPLVEPSNPPDGGPSLTRERGLSTTSDGPATSTPRLDVPAGPLRLADVTVPAPRPAIAERAIPDPAPVVPPPILVGTATPRPSRPLPDPPAAGPRSELNTKGDPLVPKPATPLPPNLAEADRALSEPPPSPAEAGPARRGGRGAIEAALEARDRTLRADTRLRPQIIGEAAGANELGDNGRAGSVRVGPVRARPESSGADGLSPGTGSPAGGGASPDLDTPARPDAVTAGMLALDRVTPKPRSAPGGDSGLAALEDRPPGRTLAEIPRVYQPRLDPDRPSHAQRLGGSKASELAVERALDWLARHQDDDGHWDAGIGRYDDGTPAKGEHDFTSHCPPGEVCFGECAYWEADTAVTGLALLTYLGAGYTHTQGRYSEAVGKGLDFLMSEQKPDGDLRGQSRVVGMYCHGMATLALCEGYALTGDSRLREAATRAVAFLVRARAKDGLAWRYAPGAPVGDTSILGWVVMGLKSAKEVGIPIPDETSVRRGTLLWLEKVASGESSGLARYQPGEPVTPTMTAEAWVCRQFLGVGGPGPASAEAAEFLLRNDSDRGPTNIYYWYYATLALYQHGGEPWARWNDRVRDRIVKLQRTAGHQAGSWDPDESLYGSKGGRIYCTTLAAMTLEVYYRYLRLYDEPKIPTGDKPTPGARPPGREPPDTVSNPEDR
jgi:hypothetical protein